LSTSSSLTAKSSSSCIDLLFATAPTCLWQLGNIVPETLTFWTEGASWDRRSRARGGERARSGRFSSHRALSAALRPSPGGARGGAWQLPAAWLSRSVPWPARSGSRQLHAVRRVGRRHQRNGSTRSSPSFFLSFVSFPSHIHTPLFVPRHDMVLVWRGEDRSVRSTASAFCGGLDTYAPGFGPDALCLLGFGGRAMDSVRGCVLASKDGRSLAHRRGHGSHGGSSRRSPVVSRTAGWGSP
jgi:hypothetical protein